MLLVPCHFDAPTDNKCQSTPSLTRILHPVGATLIEVLVSLLFIGIFSAGVVGLAVTVVQGNRQARSMDIAVYLAQDRLETIRNTAYASVVSATFPDEPYGSITAGSPPTAYPAYRRSVSIQLDTPTSNMKRVVVTVEWQGGQVREEMLVGL